MTGSVTISMMMSTSITSISGVVFISIMGAPSPPPEPTDIPIVLTSGWYQRV